MNYCFSFKYGEYVIIRNKICDLQLSVKYKTIIIVDQPDLYKPNLFNFHSI